MGCGLFLAAHCPVWAQSAGESTDEAEQLRFEREREALRLQAESARPGTDLTQPLPNAPEQEAQCFTVNDIKVEGVSLLPALDLQAILAPYARTCMGEATIKALVQALDATYVRLGYITSRAYIPDQDLSTGVLRIAVVEGFIEAIEFEENGVVREDASSRRKVLAALPVGVGDFLNLRDIEQGLDQMGRVSSDAPTVDLRPGEQTGGTVLVVKSTPENQYRGVV